MVGSAAGACGGSSEGGTGSGASAGSAGSAAGGASGGAGAQAGSSATVPSLGEPCDITAAPDPCATGVCAGTPAGGFYCREECQPTDRFGDACPDGVCLSTRDPDGGDAVLVCMPVDDCDHVTSDGCDVAAGEACVVVDFEPLQTACVAAGTLGAGEPCDASAAAACAPGLACLGSDLEDDEPGVCTPLCRPGDPLPDGCAQCIELTAELGSCAECSVLAQDCPAGSQCYPVSEALGGVCVRFGPGDVGDLCSFDFEQSCQSGLLCMEEEDPDGPDPMRCVEICDLSNPRCTDPTLFCNDIGMFDAAYETGQLALCVDLGQELCWSERGVACSGDDICFGSAADHAGFCLQQCDPTEGELACDGNYACAPLVDGELDWQAFLTGNGICGVGCATDAQCGAGSSCLAVDGLAEGGLCGPTCDPNAVGSCPEYMICASDPDESTTGTCIVSPYAGVCYLDGTGSACPPSSYCVAVQPEDGLGVCMIGCHVQAPDACGELGMTCIERNRPASSTGICLGSPEACDPVAQTGCAADENCNVLGGGAFGGYAMLCDAAGDVAEGGDCSGDGVDCALGLLCVADVCRAPCAPAADQCATGSCEDIGSNYYLSDGTVGACSTQ